MFFVYWRRPGSLMEGEDWRRNGGLGFGVLHTQDAEEIEEKMGIEHTGPKISPVV